MKTLDFVVDSDAAAVSVNTQGGLMVCLHKASNKHFVDSPLGGNGPVGPCPECGTIPLIDLIRADVNLCLSYVDKDGEVKPLRPEVILGMQ